MANHFMEFVVSNKKFVVISSCAYTEATNVFDSLLTQYDAICGKGNYTAILCPQLKTLIELKTGAREERFLNKFKEAGSNFIKNGVLSEEELTILKKPPFSLGAYKVLLNNFWTEQKNK